MADTTALPPPSSYWIDTAPGPDRTGRQLPDQADVVVVGAGITGLTTGYVLACSGRSVVVLDSGRVAAGVSGHTTAKVSAQHSLIYADLRRVSLQTAARYGAAQLAAIEWIAAESTTLNVDCEFERRDSLVYSTSSRQRSTMEDEATAASEAGMPASFVEHTDLPVDTVGAVKFTDQAQFHPRKWLLALAAEIESLGGHVIEGTRALTLSERRALVVHTDRGDVRARDVIVATHYPVFDRGGFFARLEPTRELAVSGLVPDERAPHSMSMDASSSHSVRTARDSSPGQTRLVVLGEPYRTGQRVDVEQRYQRLASWANETLGMDVVTHRWSAHDMATPDKIPYVGRYHPGARHLWVATGFAQWGMTNGTAAAHLLHDLVLGTADSAQRDLFDPNRMNLRSVPTMVRANTLVAGHFGADRARAVVSSTKPADLGPDQATVTRVGGQIVAAYREPGGNLHTVSATCTHLGCLVNFNNAEKSWDCPCHASRFAPDGTVLHGPAVKPLESITGTTPGDPAVDRSDAGA